MTASTAKQEVIPTPRGTHPNSLANLQKGKATQFGATGDLSAKEASQKGVEARAQRKTLREGLIALLEAPVKTKDGQETDKTGQDAIIAGLFKRAVNGDTRAFEIIRDTIGEKPTENVKLTGDFAALDDSFSALDGDAK